MYIKHIIETAVNVKKCISNDFRLFIFVSLCVYALTVGIV